jgi:hypothetical protein
MRNPERAIAEIRLVSTVFGEVCFDPDDPSVVLIEYFPLPPDYNRESSELVIDLGDLYPELPPKDWYLSKGLRKNDTQSSHYYENGFPSKEYCSQGYAWYSFHIKKWKPDPETMIPGDNLLTAIDAFYHALKTD